MSDECNYCGGRRRIGDQPCWKCPAPDDSRLVTAETLYHALKDRRGSSVGREPIYLTKGGRYWVVLLVNPKSGAVAVRRVLADVVDHRNLVDLDAIGGDV